MFTIRVLTFFILAATVLVQPAFAQNKATIGKSVTEFLKVSQGLATNLADLTKRTASASPNDKEMLRLATSQLGLVDATADGVVALGLVAAEVRDGGDMAIAKKQLATRCNALKTLTEATGKYVGSLVPNIAAVATAAELTKARDLAVQMGQHALCNPGKA